MRRRLAALLLAAAATVAQDPLDPVLPALRQATPAGQLAAFDAFAARPEAPLAIPALLDRIAAEAPRLDNDGCLLLAAILRAHPSAPCPLPPLLGALARPRWTSRQKAAEVVALLLRRPGAAAGCEQAVAQALVPLLTSQRGRVRTPAARALAALAGEDLGDAVAARAWFHRRFGIGIDLLAGVHEEVLVVTRDGGNFRLPDGSAGDLRTLSAAVQAAHAAAAQRRRTLGVVLQLPTATVDATATTSGLGDLEPVVTTLAATGADVTLAPAGDTFHPPFRDDPPDAPALRARLQPALAAALDGLCPGAQAAVVLPDGACLPLQTGVADRDTGTPMPADGRLLAGSTGKTFFAALALQLVREGALRLDEAVALRLGDEPWFHRLPNARALTARHLLQHTSGLSRYEFDPAFVRALVARPDHRFTPVEQLAFVLDQQPRFAAGEGFEYADTNYVLLGLLLERVTGRSCYDEITRRFLLPLGLGDTVPAVGRRIPGLLPSYAGAGNPFGGRDAMLQDGALPFDPGFEGAGGGFATSARDLARWAAALYGGDVLAGLLEQAVAGRPAPLGRGTRYGLGVIVDDTPLGPAWGHRGFFPGSMSELRWFPRQRLAVAVLVNGSADRRLGRVLPELAIELARLAAAR